jgi:hypothetical protein
MRYKALLLDFYGTLVEEDDQVIEQMLPKIVASSPLAPEQREVGRLWITHFRTLCAEACGETFRTQQQIEQESLMWLLDQYQASADCDSICMQLFTHWRAPRHLKMRVGLSNTIRCPSASSPISTPTS